MKNQMIQTAAVVPSLRVADITYNSAEIIRLIRENRDCGLIVFPELSVTGYTCGDLFASDLLLKQAEKALFTIAEETADLNGLTVAVGVPVRLDNSLYNCAAIISEGEVCALIPKEYIPDHAEYSEGRWFASGRTLIGRTVVLEGKEIPIGIDIIAEDEESGAMIGVQIGSDLFVPDKPGTHAALAGANIIISPAASAGQIGREEALRIQARAQSASCHCAYVFASAGMDESTTDLVFAGQTMIFQNGKSLAEGIFPERPYAVKALADISRLSHERLHDSTFHNDDSMWYRRIPVSAKAAGGNEMDIDEMAKMLSDHQYPLRKFPFIPEDMRERAERCREILTLQANGLATRLRATRIRNLVIGISGGLDSTLALIVCSEVKKILPDIYIIAYTMPSEGNTSGLTYSNASELMRLLADEIHEAPIGEGVKMHLQQIGHTGTYQGEGDTAYENAQARMRTYILMDVANMRNGLVVGTGDLSELALGWCTYNGDHMAMYGVNASVPKTLVRYICRFYAETCGNEALKNTLLSICDTPITPELTPSKDGEIAQKTEDKIGKYDLNDFFLYYTLRCGFEPAKSAAFAMCAYPELTKEEILSAAKRFFGRFFSQQFKRSCLPDGPKVGSVGVSPRGDLHMPSDASSRLWLDDLK